MGFQRQAHSGKIRVNTEWPPGGVEPPPADSKFGPEPRPAETYRDESVCLSGFCLMAAVMISGDLGESGGPTVAPSFPSTRR